MDTLLNGEDIEKMPKKGPYDARLRGPGERMFAQLKTWSILDQIRCDPHQVTQIAKAVQVLNSYEHHSA